MFLICIIGTKDVCGQFFRGLPGRPHVGVYGVADFLLKLTCLNNFSAENVNCQFHAFFGNTLSDVPHKTGLGCFYFHKLPGFDDRLRRSSFYPEMGGSYKTVFRKPLI